MERKNQYGRSYVNGKAISDELGFFLVVAIICEMGRNIETKYVPRGVLTVLTNKYKLIKDTVNKVLHSHNTGKTGQTQGRPKKLIKDDKDYVSALKQMQPSMQLVTMKDKLLQHSNNVQSVSKNTLSRTLRQDLSLTYKKITKCNRNRFTVGNLMFIQKFIDYVHS